MGINDQNRVDISNEMETPPLVEGGFQEEVHEIEAPPLVDGDF